MPVRYWMARDATKDEPSHITTFKLGSTRSLWALLLKMSSHISNVVCVAPPMEMITCGLVSRKSKYSCVFHLPFEFSMPECSPNVPTCCSPSCKMSSVAWAIGEVWMLWYVFGSHMRPMRNARISLTTYPSIVVRSSDVPALA